MLLKPHAGTSRKYQDGVKPRLHAVIDQQQSQCHEHTCGDYYDSDQHLHINYLLHLTHEGIVAAVMSKLDKISCSKN
jgi:hypothetical protein